jgi:mycothiol synthase
VNTRPATRDDLGAVADLFGAVEEAVNGRPSRLDANVVEGWFQKVPFETNTWLVEEDGALVAGAFAELEGGRGASVGSVHPSARGRGLGTHLVDLAESRLVADGAERLHAWTVAGDPPAGELFRQRGYREIRRFYEMAIELGEEPPGEAEAPVEVFREEDAPAFHAALEEAFSDHWGHRPEPFEEWWNRQRLRSNFDPSVWFVIRGGDGIAGVAKNESDHGGDGYVAALGVRADCRGRGYGRALLLHSFRELHRRGLRRVTLGVDAANETGATQLYESAGMHAEQETIVWEKLLST